MNVADAVAHILKAEGVEYLFAYPVNPLIEAAAKVDIRPILVRQERIGLHMADALSRMTSGKQIGVFCMQSGPGAENAFGGVAQAFGDSAPILVLPLGYSRKLTNVQPNFNSALNYRHVTKLSEQVILSETVPEVMRRAFTQVRNGRPRPVLVEFPGDVFDEEIAGPLHYRPAPSLRTGPDPRDVEKAATMLLDAQRPVIYAGQGVHYAEAWEALRDVAELLEAPVTTSLGGKSAFPENHQLSLGSGGRSISKPVHHFLQEADLIFGIGCSFTRTNFGVSMPEGKRILHATLDPGDINKDVEVEHALVGDAKLILEALAEEVRERLDGQPRGRAEQAAREIAALKREWLSKWMPKLTLNEAPLSPYRVIRGLMQTVDVPNTIITHDAGSPRDQLSPFWESHTPLSYIGWGKTTQLGYGLGPRDGREAGLPGQAVRQRLGRCRHRVHRNGLRDGRSGADTDSVGACSITSAWRSSFRLCPYPPKNTAALTFPVTTPTWLRRSEATGSAWNRPTTSCRPSSGESRRTEEGVPVLLEFITAKEIEFSLF